jgi:hypothetical protein
MVVALVVAPEAELEYKSGKARTAFNDFLKANVRQDVLDLINASAKKSRHFKTKLSNSPIRVFTDVKVSSSADIENPYAGLPPIQYVNGHWVIMGDAWRTLLKEPGHAYVSRRTGQLNLELHPPTSARLIVNNNVPDEFRITSLGVSRTIKVQPLFEYGLLGALRHIGVRRQIGPARYIQWHFRPAPEQKLHVRFFMDGLEAALRDNTDGLGKHLYEHLRKHYNLYPEVLRDYFEPGWYPDTDDDERHSETSRRNTEKDLLFWGCVNDLKTYINSLRSDRKEFDLLHAHLVTLLRGLDEQRPLLWAPPFRQGKQTARKRRKTITKSQEQQQGQLAGAFGDLCI